MKSTYKSNENTTDFNTKLIKTANLKVVLKNDNSKFSYGKQNVV